MLAQPDEWRWDQTSSYDLTVDIVDVYLKELFGNYQFWTAVREFHHFKMFILMRNFGRMPIMILFDSGSPEISLMLVALVFCGKAYCIF